MTGNANLDDAAAALPPGARATSSLKQKAAEELRSFLVLFLYLWVLFGVFVLNQSVVMREAGMNFVMQGFALINALIFAKIMMLFEMVDPGRWLRRRPLIYPIVYETVLLTILFILVHILEKVIEGALHGKSFAASLPTIGGGGLAGLLSAAVIMFIALLPFFGMRNLSMALGPGRLRALLFGEASGERGSL